MSEIQNDKAKQAQELRDLQESYRKRRRAVQEEGEQQLESAREDNKHKQTTEARESAAAISHVRDVNKKTLRDMKDEADQRIVYERRNVDKRMQNDMSDGKYKEEKLKESLSKNEKYLRNQIEGSHRRAGEVLSEETRLTQKFRDEQMSQRSESARVMSEDLNRAQKAATDKKKAIMARNDQEMADLNAEQKNAILEARAQAKRAYEQQRKVDHEQMKSLTKDNEQRFVALQKDYTARQGELKMEAANELNTEKQSGEDNLNNLRKENQKSVETEISKGLSARERTRKDYDKEIARLHTSGDRAVAEQQKMNKEKMEKLSLQNKAQIDEMTEAHEENLKAKNDYFQKQDQELDTYYKEQLLQQRIEFAKEHTQGNKAFAEAIRSQKERYAQSLMREKAEIAKSVGRNSSRAADPFYNLVHADATIEESDSHYFINTVVPEHEKDNVKMHVKDGKVIVQGSRRYEDQIQDAGAKLATNNYQTFREEIPLERPVHEKLAERSYANGILTLKVPKA